MELLARGRSADVYALDDSWVLRRYFVDNDTSVEAAVMAYVREHGVPVPLVRSVNRTDMVLERIHGPTMGEAMLAGRLALDEAAHQLADLHKRLHAVPSRTADLAARVLHMDIHPYNVMMSDTGPVLIDWCNVRDGPPELDVAMTALILAEQVAAGAVESSVIRSFIAASSRWPTAIRSRTSRPPSPSAARTCCSPTRRLPGSPPPPMSYETARPKSRTDPNVVRTLTSYEVVAGTAISHRSTRLSPPPLPRRTRVGHDHDDLTVGR
jgi:aminoglycoside phosphotransferase (APT) family kinase protein